MARSKPIRSRADVVTQLVDLFFRHGYNGTTLSLISTGTGLGRASLYHHFPGGKEEMARAVLEQAEIWGEQFVGRILTDGELPAGERLLLAMKNLDAVHYTPEQLSPASAFVVGEGVQFYRTQVQGYFRTMTDMLTELLQAIGQPEAVARRRAWEFQLLWEGALACARVMDNMQIFRDLMRNMPAYLLAPADNIGCLSPDFSPPARPSPVIRGT